jgi:hypothetical protein
MIPAAAPLVTAHGLGGPVQVDRPTADALLDVEIRRMETAIALDDQHRRLRAELEARGVPPGSCLLTRAHIIATVARIHGLAPDALKGPERLRSHAWPRQEAMYVMFMQRHPATGQWRWSAAQIGAALGGRDHSTVLWGIRRHCARKGLPYHPRDTHSAEPVETAAPPPEAAP